MKLNIIQTLKHSYSVFLNFLINGLVKSASYLLNSLTNYDKSKALLSIETGGAFYLALNAPD